MTEITPIFLIILSYSVLSKKSNKTNLPPAGNATRLFAYYIRFLSVKFTHTCVKLIVSALEGEQFLMSAPLDNAALLKHHNGV